VFAKGITIGGVKYMGIKGDARYVLILLFCVFLLFGKFITSHCRSIYGKKGATGVVLVKTTQCILFGYYNEKQQPGNAAVAVEKLADYLIENGY
jgi:profilin